MKYHRTDEYLVISYRDGFCSSGYDFGQKSVSESGLIHDQ